MSAARPHRPSPVVGRRTPRHRAAVQGRDGRDRGSEVALRRFSAADPEERRGRWLALARMLVAQFDGIPETSVRLADRRWREVPQVELTLRPGARGTALALMQVLKSGSPPMFADPARFDEQVVVFGTSGPREADPPVIAARARNFLGRR